MGGSKPLLQLTLLAIVVATSVCSQKDILKLDLPSKLYDNAKYQHESEDYRLPKSIIPTAYKIDLKNIDFLKSTFEGSVEIDALVTESTKRIVFHRGRFLNDRGIQVYKNGSILKTAKPDYDQLTEQVTITLTDDLSDSEEIKIKSSFDGVLRDDMIGFYKSSYLDENKTTM